MLQMEGILPLKAQQEMQTSNLSFITKARKFSNVESKWVAYFSIVMNFSVVFIAYFIGILLTTSIIYWNRQINQMDGIVTNGAANDADSFAIITTCKWMQVCLLF